MRYFGEKSLSAWIHLALKAAWYLVIVGSISLIAFLAIALFPALGGNTSTLICQAGQSDPEWRDFVALPTSLKALVFPYLGLVTYLLLQVLAQSQRLFANFRHNAIFTAENVASLSKLSRYLIAFSVATFNASTLLVSLILLLVCEIFKNGTALQEEHDLTV